MGTEVFLGYNEFYNFGKGIEVGHTIGTGLMFATKEAIPMTLRYPGKLVYDADSDTYWFTLSDKSFVSFHDAILIRDSLQTLIGADMLDSKKVLFEGTQSVFDKIKSLTDENIAKLPRVQLSLQTDSYQYIVSNQLIEIHSIYINRQAYFGVKGAANIGLMDFYYEHTGGNTVVTLAPSLNLAFVHQDLIEIYYTV